MAIRRDPFTARSQTQLLSRRSRSRPTPPLTPAKLRPAAVFSFPLYSIHSFCFIQRASVLNLVLRAQQWNVLETRILFNAITRYEKYVVMLASQRLTAE